MYMYHSLQDKFAHAYCMPQGHELVSRLLDPPVLRGKSSISWSEFSESLIQASMVPSGLSCAGVLQ